MLGIKKKGRSAALKFHESVGGFMSQFFSRLRKKTRFDGRIRIANMWARKHPRRTVIIYGIIAVALIAANVFEFCIYDIKGGTDAEEVQPGILRSAFERQNRITENNMIIREKIENLNAKKMQLIEEFDSLKNLSQRSHEDSLRMYSLFHGITNN